MDLGIPYDKLAQKRTRQKVYIVRVTDILYGVETIEDTGLPKDSIWKAEKIYYGIRVKGRRIDHTNMPLVSILVPMNFGGKVYSVQIGDLLLVLDDPSVRVPIAIGVLYSQTTTWGEAIKNYERPLPPQLESPGKGGELINYNAIYGTYIPTYKPSEPDKSTWYDRFIKFPTGTFYTDKRSLFSYNKWYSEALNQQTKGISDVVVNIADNLSCLYRKEKFFYLAPTLWPFRPDPVFDTTSQAHSRNAITPVIKSHGGVGLFDERQDKTWTDKFPSPLTQQDDVQDQVKYVAFDEIINATLEEVRKEAKNFDNAQLPLDPRVSQEIRIGRNKLIISDIHGDGSTILISLKNEKDAGISIVYQEFSECEQVETGCQSYKETDAEYLVDTPDSSTVADENAQTVDSANTDCDGKVISQVRIRGPLGESLLIESYGETDSPTYSRIAARGINGQLFEIYDDYKDGTNYIYGLSGTLDGTKDDWSLSKGSFFLLGVGTPPSFLRLDNNPALTLFSEYHKDTFSVVGQFDLNNSVYALRSSQFSGKEALLREYVKSGSFYWQKDTIANADASSVSLSEQFNDGSGNTFNTNVTVGGSVSVKWLGTSSSGASSLIEFSDSGSAILNLQTKFSSNIATITLLNGDISMDASNTIKLNAANGIELNPGTGTVSVADGTTAVQLSNNSPASKLFSS